MGRNEARLILKILPPILILLSLMLLGCGETEDGENGADKPTTIIELLPGDDDISGWSRDGSFSEATNYSALYDLINGGAEKFMDNGFVSAVFQDYRDESGLRIEIRIYQHSSEEDARSIYEDTSPPATIPWEEIAGSGRIDNSTLTTYSVEFHYGDLFVQVIVQERSDRALEIDKLFASHVLEQARRMYE
jgi:hypothetical protein